MRKPYIVTYISKDNPYYCMSRHGAILEHRLIMAQYLGRPLISKELVHHRDNNPSNNELSNLQLVSYAQHIDITALNTARRRVLSLQKLLVKAIAALKDLEDSLDSIK